MKVTGFTIIRNAVKYDYPVIEAISSVLPICDEFIVSIGDSEDSTEELVKKINSPKLKILHSIWDDSLREGGKLLSIETNKAFDAISPDSDWCFYIQSDEVIHENDLTNIKAAMLKYKDDNLVEGLLFNYLHFYGNYKYIGTSRRWYRKEIRVIKNNKAIRSYKDAQGFRKSDGAKLNVKPVNASVYHYGWVKPPRAQQAKQQNFHKMWHNDEWIKKHISDTDSFDYSNIDVLEAFKGTHPSVMLQRINKQNWHFKYDKSKIKMSFKNKLLFFIEKLSGWRVGEYKNYNLLK